MKQLGQVLADYRIIGEHPDIAVLAGSPGMVIPCADVGIALQATVIAPDHEDYLAVGLQPHHPEGDVNANFLECFSPFYVCGLIEPGHQLNNDGNLLAVLGGVDQVLDDAGVRPCPVERHLYDQHLGIGTCFFEESLH